MIHSQPLPARRVRLPFGLLTAVGLAVLLFLAAQLLVARVRLLRDDWRYGRPRTMQLTAYVGHEEPPGRPTQLIALNLDRDPVILEFPGGSVEKARTLRLPRLIGVDADLVPVVMRLELVNADKTADLVITMQGEEFIYINEGGSFRLINDAERAALEGK